MHVKIKVTPRARQTEFIGKMADGTLKIRLKAVPEDGRANAELIAFLSGWCKIDPSEIKILSGKTNPHKIVHIPIDFTF